MLPMKLRPGPPSPASCSCTATSSGVPFPGSSPLESRATRGDCRPHHRLGKRRSHVGELDEMLRTAGDVGPDIEQEHRGGAGHRDREREGGAIDPAVAAEVEQSGGEGRAGGAAGDEGLRAAIGHGAGGLHDRGIRRRAHGERGVGRLGDRDRRIHDLDVLRRRSPICAGPARTGCTSDFAGRGGGDGSGRYLSGTEVRPARIDGNRDHVRGRSVGLLARRRDHFAALVATAGRANPMREPRAVARRAGVVRRLGQLVLSSALRGAGMRLLLLGDSHGAGG